tara:strand:+ start:355 stop:1077 length:723 start_codon:yes stop_codon:yes gene_type:complete
MCINLKKSVLVLAMTSVMTSAQVFAMDSSQDQLNKQKQTGSHQMENTNKDLNHLNKGAEPAISDAEIKRTLQKALSEYAGQLQVKIENNQVFLSGELPSDTDYEKVVTVSESMKGVEEVHVDDLTVKDSEAPLQDTYITAKVKGSLIQADIMGQDLPSWTVDVETKNGTVYLSGSVSSQKEIDSVMDVVKKVKGVKDIDNQLVVEDKSPESPTESVHHDAPSKTGKTTDAVQSTDDMLSQ